MVIYLKENGIKIKLMEKESIYILMGQNMRGNGKMIYNMDMVRKFGMMDLNIQGIIFKGKNKDKVNMNGQMVLILKENGRIIK